MGSSQKGAPFTNGAAAPSPGVSRVPDTGTAYGWRMADDELLFPGFENPAEDLMAMLLEFVQCNVPAAPRQAGSRDGRHYAVDRPESHRPEHRHPAPRRRRRFEKDGANRHDLESLRD